MEKHSGLWNVAVGLSLFGIALAIYLLTEQITRSSFQPCNINSFVNCNAIISGPVANTFGIPTPLIGLMGYVVLLFASLRKMKRLLLGTAIFGLVFCLWIAYIELFLLHVICPVCILCQVTMLSVFTLSVIFLLQKNK